MGKFDGILNVFKMNGEDEDDYDDYDGYDDDEYASPKPAKKSDSTSDPGYDDKKTSRGLLSPKTVTKNAFGTRKGSNMNNMEVCVIKPTSFDDSLQIADALLEGRSVVLNLEGIDKDLAQRIVDFVTGSCYSLKAHFEAISKFVFVITPEAVYISGATQESGFNGGKDFQI